MKQASFILPIVLVGLALGNIFFYSASYLESIKKTGKGTALFLDFFLKTTVFGFIAFFAGYFLAYNWLKAKRFINIFFIILTFTLLILLLTKAETKRWLVLGNFSIQPAELIKPFILLFGISVVSGIKTKHHYSWLRRMIIFWLPTIAVVILIYLEPALTNSILIFSGMLIVYLSLKPKLKEIIILSCFFLFLVTLSFLWSYRLERLFAFLKPETSEKSYHTKLLTQAIVSGGWLGRGLGGSVYKIVGIPQMLSDSIFSIVAEELGFVFSTLLILSFLIIILYLLNLGSKMDNEGRAFVYGAVTIFGLQTFIHIAGNLGLIPLTGVVLPFISQGGTAQISFFLSIGLIKGFYERWGKKS